jgi:hypothetical protein
VACEKSRHACTPKLVTNLIHSILSYFPTMTAISSSYPNRPASCSACEVFRLLLCSSRSLVKGSIHANTCKEKSRVNWRRCDAVAGFSSNHISVLFERHAVMRHLRFGGDIGVLEGHGSAKVGDRSSLVESGLLNVVWPRSFGSPPPAINKSVSLSFCSPSVAASLPRATQYA